MTTHNEISEQVAATMHAPSESADAPMMTPETTPEPRNDTATRQPTEKTATAGQRRANRRPGKHGVNRRPPDVMGEGHPSPPGSDIMGDSLYEPGETRPPSVMGEGHPSPPGSDIMGNPWYDSDGEDEADPETT